MAHSPHAQHQNVGKLPWWDCLNPVAVKQYIDLGGDPNVVYAEADLYAATGHTRDERIKRLTLSQGVTMLHIVVSSFVHSIDGVFAMTHAHCNVDAATSTGKTAYDLALEYHEEDWPQFIFTRLCPTHLKRSFFMATNRHWPSGMPWPASAAAASSPDIDLPITLVKCDVAPTDLRPNLAVNPIPTTSRWSSWEHFQGAFATELRKPGVKGVAVFVHGFNSSCKSAVDNALLACTELQGFVPFCFCWPSRESPNDYVEDCHACETAAMRYEVVLSGIISLCDDWNKRVVCLGQGLGCRLMMRALSSCAIVHGLTVNSVLLAVPDMDRAEYLERVASIANADRSTNDKHKEMPAFLLLACGKEPKFAALTASGRPFQRAGLVDADRGVALLSAPFTMSIDLSKYSVGGVSELLSTGGFFKFRFEDASARERVVMEHLVRDIVIDVLCADGPTDSGSRDLIKKFSSKSSNGLQREFEHEGQRSWGYTIHHGKAAGAGDCVVS